jgi:hypothetical protein
VEGDKVVVQDKKPEEVLSNNKNDYYIHFLMFKDQVAVGKPNEVQLIPIEEVKEKNDGVEPEAIPKEVPSTILQRYNNGVNMIQD